MKNKYYYWIKNIIVTFNEKFYGFFVIDCDNPC